MAHASQCAGLILVLVACTGDPEPTPDEVLAALVHEPLPPGAGGARLDVASAPPSRWEALRIGFDHDADGRITRAELAGRDFVRFDRDANGVVELADFPVESGELSARLDRALNRELASAAVERVFGAAGERLAASWPARFRALDEDLDMALDRGEFEAALAPVAGRRDPFSALLDLGDSDFDDRLDFVELAELFG